MRHLLYDNKTESPQKTRDLIRRDIINDISNILEEEKNRKEKKEEKNWPISSRFLKVVGGIIVTRRISIGESDFTANPRVFFLNA